jgi:ABC-type lipoprotein release transport system permease subunit
MAHRKDKYVDHVLVRYTPRQAIRDAVGFVVRFFSPANLKHGIRSVTGGFREFAVFFFAMLLVQLMFWFPMLAMEARVASVKKEAYSAADYHLKIDGMSTDDWSAYYNSTFMITDTFEVEDRLYDSYEYSKYVNGSGRTCYELKILMNSDEESQSRLFLIMYPTVGENTKVEYSPRVTYLAECSRIRALFVPIIIVLGLLSSVILLILYNIRINHYKFRYGVYMSFGADFEKLFHTAAWELFSIALLTFIPALAIALIARIIMSLTVGGSIGFGVPSVLIALVWLFLVILLAVFPSVKFLATRTPTSLIVAGDNSNYVSSPRTSFRIFRKTFPMHYELFGFWRFRRYYATLLASAIIFSSIFLCGAFINSMVTASENTDAPEFTLKSYSEDGVDTMLIEEFSEIDGVRYVSWERSLDATAINSYVLLNRRQHAGISSKTVKTDSGGYADNNFKYSLIDETLYSQITREGGWKIEGDLSRVMNEENCIAVSEYINNSEALNFKVGDKVSVGIFLGAETPISYDVPDNKYILNQLINNGKYDQVELEIAAIVDSGDTDDRYMIGMSESLFERIVGRTVNAGKADIYLENGLSYEEVDSVFEQIRSGLSTFDNVSIINNRSALQTNSAEKSTLTPVVLACAFMVLLIVPPVWFFSQSMFGSKRKVENNMLSAFGATDKEIGKLYLFSGCSLTIPAAFATALLGWGITELIFTFVNEFLTSLGMGADFRYSYEFSFVGLLVCILISAVSAISSTYLPFAEWKKERDRTAKRHLGE